MVTPFQRAVVFWVLVHVVAVGVLATLAFVIVAEVAERNTFPLQQPPRLGDRPPPARRPRRLLQLEQ